MSPVRHAHTWMEEGSHLDMGGGPPPGAAVARPAAADVTLSVDLETGGGLDDWLGLKRALYPEWTSEQEYILYYLAQAREWHGLPTDAAINRFMLTYNMIELHNYSADVGATVVQYCMSHPHPLRRLIGAYYRPYCTIPLYKNGIDVVIYDEAPVLEGIDNIIGLAEKYGITIERPPPPPLPSVVPAPAPASVPPAAVMPPPRVSMEGPSMLAQNEISLDPQQPPMPAVAAAVEVAGNYGPKAHRDKKGD
jgi:hypothetical protein